MPYVHDGPPLYLADDQATIVDAGDPRAAFLLVATGGTLPDDVAKQHGLPRAADAKAAPEKTNKARAPRENKGE